jgi:hypothetical protein
MKSLIRLYGFVYGSLGTLFALAWNVSVIRGHVALPGNWSIVVAVFSLHVLAGIITFDRTHVRPAWQPVLPVTTAWIRFGKTLLGIGTAYFIGCLGVFIYAEIRGSLTLEDATVPLVLTSFLLQNTIYIAVHWAFRPENLFSGSFIRAFSNPLGLLFPGNKNR